MSDTDIDKSKHTMGVALITHSLAVDGKRNLCVCVYRFYCECNSYKFTQLLILKQIVGIKLISLMKCLCVEPCTDSKNILKALAIFVSEKILFKLHEIAL